MVKCGICEQELENDRAFVMESSRGKKYHINCFYRPVTKEDNKEIDTLKKKILTLTASDTNNRQELIQLQESYEAILEERNSLNEKIVDQDKLIASNLKFKEENKKLKEDIEKYEKQIKVLLNLESEE